jgi:hypothetical protein
VTTVIGRAGPPSHDDHRNDDHRILGCDLMPQISFVNLLIVAAVAVLAPLLLGYLPRLRLPAVMVEIVAGVVLGRQSSAGCKSTYRSRSWPSSAWLSCCFWPGWRSTCMRCGVMSYVSLFWAMG